MLVAILLPQKMLLEELTGKRELLDFFIYFFIPQKMSNVPVGRKFRTLFLYAFAQLWLQSLSPPM